MNWLHFSLLVLLQLSVGFFDTAKSDNWCRQTVSTRQNVTEKCSQLVIYTIQGYNIDRQESGLDQYNDSALIAAYMEWAKNPHSSPDCCYYRYESKVIEQCCQGWSGTNCNKAVCNPPCVNGGSCVQPNQCQCKGPYTGTNCQENKSAMTNTNKYCYPEAGCGGSYLGTGAVSKSDCCSSLNGKSWGSSSDTCEVCVSSLPSKEYQDFNPAQPQVTPINSHLPFRTCMGTGPNYYKTFDGVEFLFPGRCTYVLFSDGTRSVTLEIVDCDLFSTCKKKLTFVLSGQDTVVAEGSTITCNDQPVDVQEAQGYASPSNKVHIKKKKVPTATLR